jgi:hypothetical protein
VYLELKDYKLEMDPRKVSAELGNLFGGNSLLGELRTTEVPNLTARLRAHSLMTCLCVSGDIMNRFLNANWRAVMKQIGRSIYDALGLSINEIFSDAAKTVPYQDIFDGVE